ncbi:MAG TPA: DOMON-like domain-containing protein [Caulobacteraceae bacterium]|nr:DOMON-like domain-containing protein [Caulobacteraceae bacterium]
MPPLTRHPSSSSSVSGIEADASRAGEVLTLRFVLEGAAEVVLAPPSASVRRDELWRRTCFEAFVSDGKGYVELNFAPSTEWAAYRFDAYRQGMRAAELEPRVEVARGDGGFELRAAVSGLPEGDWRVGLSAVVEETSGSLSYWALAHPPGRPDFHHPDCFALELPASPRP